MYERDVDDRKSIDNPVLYLAGQKGIYFSFGLFWKWIILSIIHGATSFYLIFYGISGLYDWRGLTYDHWSHTTIIFTVLIHLVNFKLFLETNYWNLIMM